MMTSISTQSRSSSSQQPCPVSPLTTSCFFQHYWLREIFHQRKMTMQSKKLKVKSVFCEEKTFLKSIFGNLKTVEDSDAKTIIEYFRRTCCAALEKLNKGDMEAIISAKKLIGKVIFLCEKDKKGTAFLLSRKDQLAAVEEKFNQEILAKAKEVDELIEKPSSTKVFQRVARVDLTNRILKTSEILTTSTGFITPGIIDDVLNLTYMSRTLSKEESEIVANFREMKASTRMQRLISKMIKIVERNPPFKDLIRISLELPPESEISPFHTRCVVLATAVIGGRRLIDKLFSFPTIPTLPCQPTDEPKAHIVCQINFKDPDLQKSITINREGRVLRIEEESLGEKRLFLGEIPGIKAALREFGDIKDLEDKVAERLYEIQFADPMKPLKTNLEGIITAAKTVHFFEHQTRPEKVQDLGTFALISFLSRNKLPLLQVWKSHSFPPLESHQPLYHRLQMAIIEALKKKMRVTPDVKKVFTALEGNLNKSVLYRYQPVKGNPEQMTYQLYRFSPGIQTLAVESIDTPMKFKDFILELTKASKYPELQSPLYEEIFNTINLYLNTPDIEPDSFLNEVFRSFNEANEAVNNTFNCGKDLENLPFRGVGKKESSLIKEKDKRDLGLAEPAVLLEAIIRHARKQQTGLELSPSPGFFSLLPHDPTIHEIVDHPEMDIPTWIKERFYHPMRKALEHHLTEEQKATLHEAIIKYLLPKELKTIFLERASKIEEVDLNRYCQQLAGVLANFKDVVIGNFETQICQLTNIVLQLVLPKKKVNLFEKHAVRVAQFIWKEKPLFLVLFPNPLTKKLVFGTLNEEGKSLMMLDEGEFMSHIPWEALGVQSGVNL